MSQKGKVYRDATLWVDIETGEVIADRENWKLKEVQTEETYRTTGIGTIRQTIKLCKNYGKKEQQLEIF